MQVPKSAAASSLAGCALLVLFAASIAPSSLALGSVFLLICAFGAWFVSTSFAVMLGLLLVAIYYLNGQLVDFSEAHIDQVLSLAFELGSSLTVILMLGVARAALEIEWKYARTDSLTGAHNRKAFFEALKGDGYRSKFATLIFADVDGLKLLNDSLGHEKGDEALRNFSATVRKSIRKNDLFARLGGDEFAILLEVRDAAAARLVANRLDVALNGGLENRGKLKCSLGVLILPDGSISIDAELRQADALMYEAKRNQAGLAIAVCNKGDLETLPSAETVATLPEATRLPRTPPARPAAAAAAARALARSDYRAAS